MQIRDTSVLKVALSGMIGMAAAMGIGRFVYTPILPGMMDGLAMSASAAGWIAASNYVGYLVGALLASANWAAGRERGLALGALVASTILLALMAATTDFAVFAAIRFAAGLASAFVMVFLSTLVFARLSELGRESLGMLTFAGVGVGIALSAILIALLLRADAGWQAGWLWSALLSLLATAAVAMLLSERGSMRARTQAEGALPRSWAFTGITLAYGLFGFGYIITATFLVAIVREGDTGRLLEPLVWLVTGLCILPSVWLWSVLARRIGLTTAFAVGCLVEAVGVAASVTLGTVTGPVVGGALLGGTFVAITYLGLQAGRRLAPDAPRRALAIMTAAFGIGQIAGPVFAGIVADRSGSFVLPSLGAAFALVVAAGLAWHSGRSPLAR